MTKRKFAELELSLLHLQQNVEIPETHLIIHPVIQRAVEQVRQSAPPLLSYYPDRHIYRPSPRADDQTSPMYHLRC